MEMERERGVGRGGIWDSGRIGCGGGEMGALNKGGGEGKEGVRSMLF